MLIKIKFNQTWVAKMLVNPQNRQDRKERGENLQQFMFVIFFKHNKNKYKVTFLDTIIYAG